MDRETWFTTVLTLTMRRRNLFRFANRFVEQQGFDPLHDTGQEYLYVDAGLAYRGRLEGLNTPPRYEPNRSVFEGTGCH